MNLNTDSGMLHPGVFCHCCEGNISGTRYKCTVCPDYDLCSGCQSTGLHEEHRLRSIPIPEPKKRQCKALLVYLPQNEDELELKVGDIIDIIEEVEEGCSGSFPSNFVKEVEASGEEGEPGEATADETGRELCKVAFPYEAQNEDELSIKEGEIVTIVSKDCADPGWWMGEIGGRQGVFPVNFVKMLVPDVEKEDCAADPGWWKGEIGGRQGVFPVNFVKMLVPDVEIETPKKPPLPTGPSAKLTTADKMDTNDNGQQCEMNKQSLPRKELQETLCQYASNTLNHIATVTEFCQSRSEWIDDRTLEKKTMNDIKKEESQIDLSFGHVTGSEDTGQAVVEYATSKLNMITADARREELNKKLGEVLKETRRGLEKLNPFVDAVESLAVTSLHVFAEKKQVLQLPEGTNFKSVQAVITTAKLVCPYLLQFKRESDTFFSPSFHNVDEHTTYLDKYVCRTKLICEMLERSSLREFGKMKNTKTVVQLPAHLSEGDIEEMLRHINLLTDVRMDPNFTIMFPDDSSSGFRKEFSDRRLGMLQSLPELKEIAVQLDTMKKGALISSVTGGSIGAIAGVLSIVGGVVTGGASIVLTGVGLGVACGVNSLVTKVTEIAVNKKRKKRANEIMSKFMEDLRCLREYIEEVSGKANTTLGKDNVDMLGIIKKAKKMTIGIKTLTDHVKPETDQGVREIGQGGADMGQGGAEIGQGGAEIGQGAAEMGQGAAEMGQELVEIGQGAADIGQGAAEMGAAEIGQGAAEMGWEVAEIGQGAAEIGQGAAEMGQGAAEMGWEVAEIGQGAAEIGQVAAEMGQGAAEMGQVAAEMGQVAAEMSQGAVEMGQVAAEMGQGAAEIGQVAAEMGQGAAEIGQGAAEIGQGLAASTIALNAVGLGWNIMNVCKDSISLAKGRQSEFAQLIQARVSLWHSELNSLTEIDYFLRESMQTSAEKKNCLESPFYPEN